jgi:hypothetical protein
MIEVLWPLGAATLIGALFAVFIVVDNEWRKFHGM